MLVSSTLNVARLSLIFAGVIVEAFAKNLFQLCWFTEQDTEWTQPVLPSPSSIKNNQKVGIPLKRHEIPLNVTVGHHPIGINVKIALRGRNKEDQL